MHMGKTRNIRSNQPLLIRAATRVCQTVVITAFALASASLAHAGGVVPICDAPHLSAALNGGGTVTFNCSATITLSAPIEISTDTTLNGIGQVINISGGGQVQLFYVWLAHDMSG